MFENYWLSGLWARTQGCCDQDRDQGKATCVQTLIPGYQATELGPKCESNALDIYFPRVHLSVTHPTRATSPPLGILREASQPPPHQRYNVGRYQSCLRHHSSPRMRTPRPGAHLLLLVALTLTQNCVGGCGAWREMAFLGEQSAALRIPISASPPSPNQAVPAPPQLDDPGPLSLHHPSSAPSPAHQPALGPDRKGQGLNVSCPQAHTGCSFWTPWSMGQTSGRPDSSMSAMWTPRSLRDSTATQ